MSPRSGYFVVALLPCLYVLVPGAVAFPWYWIHRQHGLPADIARKTEVIGSWVLLVAQLLVVATVWGALARAGLTFAALGLTSTHWLRPLAIAMLAATLWTGFIVAVLLVTRATSRNFAHHTFVRRDVLYSLSFGVWSALVEEVWRVFCLLALATQGAIVPVVATSVAFALSHPEPVGRLVSMAMFALYAAWLFHLTGSVWVLVFTHGLVNVGIICLVRFWHHRVQ